MAKPRVAPLSDTQLRAAMEELARRQEQLKGVKALEERIISELYDKQVDFYNDPSRFKAVLGSRRAGKTEMWARIATVKALQNPRGLIRIWHSSRLRAKDMLWSAFQWLFARHNIHTKLNETELTITFANGAVIRLVGADKDKEAQKKRGEKTVYEILLEVQNFGGYLRSMIEDVIGPSLLDCLGTLCVEGTPGALCTGPWFEISGGDNYASRWQSNGKMGEWSCHRWTLLDNPFLPHARDEVARVKKTKRWTDDNPTYLREYCGQWVNDLTALFYKFDMTRNTYAEHEVTPYGPGWQHSLGWDLGSKDDMAITIWGWHNDYRGLYEVFSWKKPGALAAEVMAVIDEAESRYKLNLIEQVADTGGGGKMYVEEVMSRYTRHFKAAKKTEKYEHVMLFNEDLLTGEIRLKLGSPLQQEMAALMRDPDWPPEDKPDAKPREAPSCANHNCDAGLYGYRAAWHYFKTVTEEAPKKGTELELDHWVRRQELKLKNQEDNWGYGANDGDDF